MAGIGQNGENIETVAEINSVDTEYSHGLSMSASATHTQYPRPSFLAGGIFNLTCNGFHFFSALSELRFLLNAPKKLFTPERRPCSASRWATAR
mmetsp:Transcript_55196/g.103480  ORF Transcript_55196/g.103480 Transcript_55196/m.103480 type:complete len:94 (-) Transcript_55196:479-760(-)